jgi:hypothetical protein
MNPQLKPIVDLYNVNTNLYLKALDMAEEKDLFDRPMGKANSLLWVAGHLAASRFTVANMLGLKVEFPKAELFNYGSEPTDSSAYPTIEEIVLAWNDISEKLMDQFEKVSDDVLAGKPPYDVPGVEKTVAGMVAFMQLHESYHVGQLAYINRLHGGDKLVG